MGDEFEFEDEGEAMAGMAELFDIPATLGKDRKAAFGRRALYEDICRVQLVPRYGVIEGKAIWDSKHKLLLTPDQFDATKHVTLFFGYKGNLSEVAPKVLLFREPTHIDVAELAVRADRPDDGFIKLDDGRWQANTYRGSTRKPAAKGSPAPTEWLDQIRWMIRDPLEAEWLVQFLALKLQQPGLYLPQIPVLWGRQGIGKDLTLAPFWKIVGEHNVRPVNNWMLQSQWTDYLGAQYLSVGEFTLDTPGGRAVYEHLKEITGQPLYKATLNPKTLPQTQMLIQPTVIATTNDDDFMSQADPDERRICVLGCTALRRSTGTAADPGSPAYFDKLVKLFYDDAYMARIHRYLLDVDTSRFNRKEPLHGPSRTEALFSSLLSHAARAAYDLVTSGLLAKRSLVTMQEVEGMVTGRNTSYRALVRGIEQAGFTKLGRFQSLPGRPTVYVRGNEDVAQQLLTLKAEEISARISAERAAQ